MDAGTDHPLAAGAAAPGTGMPTATHVYVVMRVDFGELVGVFTAQHAAMAAAQAAGRWGIEVRRVRLDRVVDPHRADGGDSELVWHGAGFAH